MDPATFRTIRVNAEFSQRELAERLQGRHQWLISHFECGRLPIPPDIAEWMTKLAQGKAGASPPKQRRAESRKAPPARQAVVKPSPRPSSSDKLCSRCLCVTDPHIPCGCWSGAR